MRAYICYRCLYAEQTNVYSHCRAPPRWNHMGFVEVARGMIDALTFPHFQVFHILTFFTEISLQSRGTWPLERMILLDSSKLRGRAFTPERVASSSNGVWRVGIPRLSTAPTRHTWRGQSAPRARLCADSPHTARAIGAARVSLNQPRARLLSTTRIPIKNACAQM